MPTENTNIGFAFRYGTKSAMDRTSVSNGCWNICTDSQQLFLDWDYNRIPLSDIFVAQTEEELFAINAPYEKIYYCEETHDLYRFEQGQWNKLCIWNVQFSKTAEGDADGNDIIDTYATKDELSDVNQGLEDLKSVVGDINRFNVVAIDSLENLPDIGEPFTIYLVPDEFAEYPEPEEEESRSNLSIEYIWIGDEESGYYEQIGVTDTDLTKYYKKTEIDEMFADVEQTTDLLQSTIDTNRINTESSIGAVNTRIDTLTTTISNNQSYVETGLANLQTNIDNVDSRVDIHDSKFSNVDSKISTIESTIADIQTGSGSQSSQITTIEGEISDIQSDISDLELADTAINTSITNINTSISSIQDRLTDLEESGITSDISELQDTVDSIETAIGNIRGDITTLQTSLADYKTEVQNTYVTKAAAIVDITADGNIFILHHGDGSTTSLTINRIVHHEDEEIIDLAEEG